mgnify:FL=1
MRILGKFGLRATLFLYLLNAPLYFFSHSWVLPATAASYLVAYYLALGKFRIPLAIYAVSAAVSLSQFAVGVEAEVAAMIFAVVASLLYAASFGRSFWRLISLFLFWLSVVVYGWLILLITPFWRSVVPGIGVSPRLPDPLDAPLYIALYQLQYFIHGRWWSATDRPPRAPSLSASATVAPR